MIPQGIKEEWRDIIEYEGLYQVSSLGNVRNKKGKLLKLQTNSKKRKLVILCKNGSKGFLVHRLVAFSFIPKIEGKEYINHIDGNPSNNKVSNLEWCTMEENFEHARINKLWRGYIWKDRHYKKHLEVVNKKVYTYNKYTKEIREYTSGVECAKYLGVKQSAISRAISVGGTVKDCFVSFRKSFNPTKNSRNYRKRIRCTLLNKDIINFDSSNEAGKVLNLDPSFIRKVCKGIYEQYKGMQFKYY